jgi:hypothetical protein
LRQGGFKQLDLLFKFRAGFRQAFLITFAQTFIESFFVSLLLNIFYGFGRNRAERNRPVSASSRLLNNRTLPALNSAGFICGYDFFF